jgi:hypothetical protein
MDCRAIGKKKQEKKKYLLGSASESTPYHCLPRQTEAEHEEI